MTTPTNAAPVLEPKNLSIEELKAMGQEIALHCREYRDSDTARSVIQLSVTLGLFLACITAMWFSLDLSYILTLIIAVPAAGFLVKLFMIQHDCGHGSFFKSSVANTWLGRSLSVLTVTPYEFWKRAHAMHHSTCGNLEKRGIGDIEHVEFVETQ